MTNWRNPAHQSAATIAHIKLDHVVAGMYIWEFVMNLDYEFSVIMQKRKFILSYPFYMGCRWSALGTVIVEFLTFDTPHKMNCQALLSLSFIFASLSVMFTSVLVILRVCALWERNKVVMAIAYASWLANAAVLTYVSVTARGHWANTAAPSCTGGHHARTRILVFSVFINDIVLLALMISGVLRWKERHGVHDRSTIWWLLYRQGLAWIALCTLIEVPPVIFLILNLNTRMNSIFLIPGVIAMTVVASRMYRGLVNGATYEIHSLRVPSN